MKFDYGLYQHLMEAAPKPLTRLVIEDAIRSAGGHCEEGIGPHGKGFLIVWDETCGPDPFDCIDMKCLADLERGDSEFHRAETEHLGLRSGM